MTASRPRRASRISPWATLLTVAVVTAVAITGARALPAHPDALLEPDAGRFGLRLRAVRRPDGSSHVSHTGSKTHPDFYIELPAAPDSQAAASTSAPQPVAGKFGDRMRPVNGKIQPPVKTKIGAWQSHPDITVVLPDGWDDNVGPADNDDGVRAEPEAPEDPKAEEVPAGEEKPSEDKKDVSEKPAEKPAENPESAGDDTRQKLPDTSVVLPPGWDEPGFRPAGNEDAVRNEENKEKDDTRNKEPNTSVVLPPSWDEPGFRPPGSEEGVRGEENNEKDDTRQKEPNTSVVLPPSWDEPGFRPPGSEEGVRGEENVQDDTRNKQPNTSVQLPPGLDESAIRPAGNEETVRDKEKEKEDDTRQKLPDTLVVLPPSWDEPGFRPPGSEETVRDEGNEGKDDTRNKKPNTSVVLPPSWDEPGFRPPGSEEGVRGEANDNNDSTVPQESETSGKDPKPSEGAVSSSAVPSDDAIRDEDAVKEDVTKETQKPATDVSSTQTTMENKPSPSNAEKPASTDTKTENESQQKKQQDNQKPARPSETERDENTQGAHSYSTKTDDKSGVVAAAPDVATSLGNPSRRNPPPEFYLTRKNHAARPHVRPPGTGPDFIAENPLFEWTFPCSSQEKSCLEEDRVLYDGDRKCYQLWRSGPCERGQWLVIDKVEALNGSGHFRAVCANMSRCPERQVYMASDRQCHPFSEIIREICPKHEGLQLSYNVFGEGECKCDNCPHPQLPTNTFSEGRCAFPPSFYRAGAQVGLEVAWRAAMAEAAAEVAEEVAGKAARTQAAAAVA